MRVLIVFCHPASDSYVASLASGLSQKLEAGGHAIRALDLYREGFEPVLDLDGWRAHRRDEGHAAALGAHIAALREAEALVLVYPTWWYGLPAMLKGWFDRVWQPGVAFTLKDGAFQPHTLANIRKFAVVTTYGSPDWFIRGVVGDPARRQLVRGLALQFAEGARTCWEAIYDVDQRTEADLAAARERAVGRVARFLGR